MYSVGTITHPQVPSNVKLISHKQFDGFGNMENVTRTRTNESSNFPRDGLMLESLHEPHRYCRVDFPNCTYGTLPGILSNVLYFPLQRDVRNDLRPPWTFPSGLDDLLHVSGR